MKDFTTEEAFRHFLEEHPENGKAYKSLKLNIPFDISFSEYKKLSECTISFGKYDRHYLLYHPTTNEIFLGHINIAGHGGQFRVVKIKRHEIFSHFETMDSWYENHAYKMWL